MAEKSEDSSSGGWFDWLKRLLWPKAQEVPTASQAHAEQPAPAQPPPVDGAKLDQLLEALQRQTARIDALLQQARASAARGGDRIVAGIEPIPGGGPVENSLKDLAQRSEEMAHELQSLVENSERQIDLLQKIQIDLAASTGDEGEKASAISRLSTAIEGLSRNAAAHAELMEQVRDRLAGANNELADAVASQGRRVAWLLVVVILFVAALAVMTAMRMAWP